MNADLPASIDRFRVLRLLGQGGMGAVFAVHDPATDRELALKLILGADLDEEALARFWREAELLARVHHRSVVRIHTLGRSARGPYLTQEIVAGQPLTDLAQRGLEPRQAARLARELADAVEAVHAAGVLHRDLKPDNVIVRPDGIPVLLDFGLAREASAGQLTRTGQAMGTPAYMSPEQARGASPRSLDARIDVYGLGAVLFEMLAARPPFAGESLVGVLVAVASDAPRWPSADRPDVPPALEAILRRAMAKEPAERYPSAAALRDALDGFLAQDPEAEAAGRRTVHVVGVGAAAVVGLAAIAAAVLAGSGSDGGDGPRPAALATATPEPSAASETPAQPLERPAPDPEQLYALGPTASKPLVFAFSETWNQYQVELKTWLTLEAAPSERDAVDTVTATIHRTAIRMNMAAMGLQSFDTEVGSPDPRHPLRGIAAGIGDHFRFDLNRATGAVTEFGGFDRIFPRVVAAGIDPSYRDRLSVALSDREVWAAFRTLLQLRGEPPVAWEEQAVRRGQRRFRLRAERAPLAIPPVLLDGAAPPSAALTGAARVADGAPLRMAIEQRLDVGDQPIVTRWSLGEEEP